MKLSATFIGLVTALPSILAATLPRAEPVIENVDDIPQAEVLEIYMNAHTSAPWNVADELDPESNLIAERVDFTVNAVTKAHSKWPQFNWLIIHVNHTTTFDPSDGKSRRFEKTHIGDPAKPTVVSAFYAFESGTVENLDKGGLDEWAYRGNFVESGNVVTFSKPVT